MKNLNLPLIEQLPKALVTPERFGRVAVGAVLPELARIYEMLPTEQGQ